MFEYLMLFFMMMWFFGCGIIFVYPVALLSFPLELLGFDTALFLTPLYRLFEFPHSEIIALIFWNMVILSMIYFFLAVPIGKMIRKNTH